MLRRTALFTALFVAAIFLGRQTVLPDTGLAVVWPAAGVGLLWVLRTRSRAELVLASVLVGGIATAGNSLTGLPLLAGAVLGVANVTVCLVTLAMLRRLGSRGVGGSADPDLDASPTAHHIARLQEFLVAASIGVAASAVVGVAAVATTDATVGWDTAVGWWMRNMTALIVVAGTAVLVQEGMRPVKRHEALEAVAVLLATAVTLGWVFGAGQDLPYAFLPFALVVWAGFRLPLPLAVAEGAVVAVGTLVLVRAVDGGPFGAVASATDQALVVQAFMMLSALVAMVIASVRAQMEDALAGMAQARRRAEDVSEDLRVVVEALPVGLFVIDREGTVLLHNSASAQWLQGDLDTEDGPVRLDRIVRKRALRGADIPEHERPSVRALNGERVEGERMVSEDGQGRPRVVSVDAVPLPGRDSGEPERAVLMWQDVTEEHEHLDRVQHERQRSDRIIADAPHGVAVLDPSGTITTANRALATLLGVPQEELVGSSVTALVPGAEQRVRAYLRDTLEARGSLVEADWVVPGPDGGVVHLSTSGRYLADEEDPEIIVTVLDVSERRRFEDRLTHLADHDALTGLPNRRYFEQALAKHQALCDRYSPRGALLLIDLDHFKEVNDTFGHAAGDQLIAAVGSVLARGVRESDIVARLGGDEFAVLLPEADSAGAETVAAGLVEKIRAHCAGISRTHQRVTASIGVVTFAAAASHESDAIVLADMLMYDAKDAGRNGYVLLTEQDHRHPRLGSRMQWRDRIERALEEDRFVIHLQPILDLSDDRVTRAEALVRMCEGEELVPPGAFVYVAELTGLAPALDAWVLRRSVAMLAALRRLDPDFSLEVNISARSIGHPDVERALREALQEHAVDPRALVLEVTETAAVSDVAAARAFGERLQALGTSFALDDFGAGYGSFYYLKHLVFDVVKIDGEFVTGAHRTSDDRQLLRSLVDVARNLRKDTVAEFVATPEELELVRDLQVDYAQGFFIGRPVGYDAFVDAHLSGAERPVAPELVGPAG